MNCRIEFYFQFFIQASVVIALTAPRNIPCFSYFYSQCDSGTYADLFILLRIPPYLSWLFPNPINKSSLWDIFRWILKVWHKKVLLLSNIMSHLLNIRLGYFYSYKLKVKPTILHVNSLVHHLVINLNSCLKSFRKWSLDNEISAWWELTKPSRSLHEL